MRATNIDLNYAASIALFKAIESARERVRAKIDEYTLLIAKVDRLNDGGIASHRRDLIKAEEQLLALLLCIGGANQIKVMR